MCVLIVPDELKAMQAEQQLKKQYCNNFDQYWNHQSNDQYYFSRNIVELEKEQDRTFLEMVKHQPMS